MSDAGVRLAVEAGVATVTLDRPARRNALSQAIVDALRETFDRLERDGDVRVAVVRGEGRAFCAGMDLDELGARQRDEQDPERAVVEVFQQIERCRVPTIAMVNGDAFAGGCELALHCDLRIAADVARFAMPLGRLGIVVPFPLGQKLVEIVGAAHTRHILLTGRPVGARRAHEIGMVHEVVALADLERVTYDLARSIAGLAPLSVQGMKAVILRAVSLRERVEHADLDALAVRARTSADAHEGVRAMLEKRVPVFHGA